MGWVFNLSLLMYSLEPKYLGLRETNLFLFKLIWLFSGLAVAKPDWLTYDDEKHSVQAEVRNFFCFNFDKIHMKYKFYSCMNNQRKFSDVFWALWTRCPYLKLPKNGKGIHCYLDICTLECKKDYVLIGKEKLKASGFQMLNTVVTHNSHTRNSHTLLSENYLPK